MSGAEVAITPLRTGAGHRAWLVVDEEGSASMGGRTDVDRVRYVVIATPPDGERLVLRLDLGTAAFGRQWTDANGDEVENPPGITLSDERFTARIVSDGLVAGGGQYRWLGDALVPAEPTRAP